MRRRNKVLDYTIEEINTLKEPDRTDAIEYVKGYFNIHSAIKKVEVSTLNNIVNKITKRKISE